MKIIDIEKRDTYFTMEFSIADLLLLKNMMDCAQFTFDSGKNPEMIKANEYFHKKFYPMLIWIQQYADNEGVVNGPPPNSE
jgi:hypothetical protein